MSGSIPQAFDGSLEKEYVDYQLRILVMEVRDYEGMAGDRRSALVNYGSSRFGESSVAEKLWTGSKGKHPELARKVAAEEQGGCMMAWWIMAECWAGKVELVVDKVVPAVY